MTNGLTLYTTASQYKGFAQLVLLYYSCTRDLPFLKCIDPYNIYNGSEINKLQQYFGAIDKKYVGEGTV
jgi:hypothetical protein